MTPKEKDRLIELACHCIDNTIAFDQVLYGLWNDKDYNDFLSLLDMYEKEKCKKLINRG